MVLRITEFGEDILRQQGEKITVFDGRLRSLAENMLETMYQAEGVGLAAQQVGHALMLCVIDISDIDNKLIDYELDGKRPPLDLFMPLVLVNPVIRLLPGPTVTAEEGCLSFPGVRGDVPRPDAIEVNYQDLGGARRNLIAQGWLARVIQHEVDHLKGVLFTDHMQPRQLRSIEAKLKKIKRASRDRAKASAPTAS